MKAFQLVIALALSASTLVLAQEDSPPRSLTGYGIEDVVEGTANSPHCDGEGAGNWVDRVYGSKCFIRQVVCDANNAVIGTRTCADNQVFTDDGAGATCVDINSAEAQTACGVTVMCDETQMTVHVSQAAIWEQTSADLQFGTTNANGACDIGYDTETQSYDASLSLLTPGTGRKWDDCGGSRSIVELGDELAVKYEFQLRRSFGRTERVEENHGAVVTREKCFMMDAVCYYKADGTASSSYKPTAADALVKTDTDELAFDMYPVHCTTHDKLESTLSVEVTTEVCFATEITSNWHQDIRISTTNCWAEPNAANAPDTVKYQLSPITGSNENDATFEWDCYDGKYKELFKFQAFRFQRATNDTWDDTNINDDSQYAQTIHLKCEVNACAVDDTSSADCTLKTDETGNTCQDPNAKRRRRALSDDMSMISKFTKDTTMAKMYVIQPDSAPAVTYNTRYNLLSDTLSMAMFATGCIFAVVALGLLIVMKRAKTQMKYRVLNVE